LRTDDTTLEATLAPLLAALPATLAPLLAALPATLAPLLATLAPLLATLLATLPALLAALPAALAPLLTALPAALAAEEPALAALDAISLALSWVSAQLTTTDVAMARPPTAAATRVIVVFMVLITPHVGSTAARTPAGVNLAKSSGSLSGLGL
jgi:hypothetical protein